MQTFKSAGAEFTIVGGLAAAKERSLHWSAPGGNGLDVAASREGLEAAHPMFDVTASRRQEEAIATRYAQARAHGRVAAGVRPVGRQRYRHSLADDRDGVSRVPSDFAWTQRLS